MWDSIGLKWLATWILPYQPDNKLADKMANIIKAAPKLDYVDVDGGFARDRVPWDDEDKKWQPLLFQLGGERD